MFKQFLTQNGRMHNAFFLSEQQPRFGTRAQKTPPELARTPGPNYSPPVSFLLRRSHCLALLGNKNTGQHRRVLGGVRLC